MRVDSCTEGVREARRIHSGIEAQAPGYVVQQLIGPRRALHVDAELRLAQGVVRQLGLVAAGKPSDLVEYRAKGARRTAGEHLTGIRPQAPLTKEGDEPHHADGVPAQSKEVIIHADAVEPKRLPKGRAHQLFALVRPAT